MRDAGRDVSLYRGALPQASSESLAAQLLGRLTTVSQKLIRAEVQMQLQQALNQMEPMDREIIMLRHFEELSNAEASRVLGVSAQAASNRHMRAMSRLQVDPAEHTRSARPGARLTGSEVEIGRRI